ncbi:MAG TPA: hypothetical protein VMH91_00885 [Candidatus Paceibacterota bacterium]|nr:hypothetical protein [Candidatus Paceibacterota bacterium]
MVIEKATEELKTLEINPSKFEEALKALSSIGLSAEEAVEIIKNIHDGTSTDKGHKE